MSYSLVDAKPIGELCQIVDCEHKTAPYVASSPYLVVRTSNVRNGKLIYDDMRFTTEDGYNKWTQRTIPTFGDVLFTREAPVGETCLVPKKLNICMGQRMVLLRPNKNYVDPVFLSYILTTERCKVDILRLSIGSTVSRVNIADIKKIKIASPPIPEQKKIAKILSTWDRAIEATEKLLNNSQQQKKSLMQQLLTGKKRLLGFSKEWNEVAIKSMGKVVSGGTPDTKVSEYWNGDVLWMTPTDVTALKNRFISDTKRKITQPGIKNSSAIVIPKRSLLVCTRATIGLMSISTTEITTNQGFKNVIPNEKYDVELLYYLFNFFKKKFISYACGSTFLELSKKDFEKLHFLCPPKEEQQKIASVLTSADKEIETLQQKLNHLKQEKKALMQQLLTGKRRVVL